MTDDRKSGVAFIAGSLGGILTMAIHPTSAGVLTPAQFERLAVVSAIAHSLAMVSFLALFLGAIGLTRYLAARELSTQPDRLALVALTMYGFAAIALMFATAVSGFIVPDITRHMVRDVPANAPQWRIVVDAVFQFNQAFARVYSIAASLSILLWSVSILRNGGLVRGIAFFGCIMAPVITILIVAGHLRLDVHGMAIVVFAQAFWFVIVGVQLCRQPAQFLVAKT
jgi:hypothetical protein